MSLLLPLPMEENYSGILLCFSAYRPNYNLIRSYPFLFSISPFDETVSGLYSCRVTIGEEEVTGYVQAQIFGMTDSLDG